VERSVTQEVHSKEAGKGKFGLSTVKAETTSWSARLSPPEQVPVFLELLVVFLGLFGQPIFNFCF
jgi:hypothetical protein